MSYGKSSGSTVLSANLPTRLVEEYWDVKRASCRNSERLAMRARERVGTPPQTHRQHRLTATGGNTGGADSQTAENQIANVRCGCGIWRLAGCVAPAPCRLSRGHPALAC